MAAGINEGIWLEWLVKVRIIIITILLAIELAIVTLTTTNVNRELFVLVILGWYLFAGLHLYTVSPPQKPVADAVQAAGGHRPVFHHRRGLPLRRHRHHLRISLPHHHHRRSHPAVGDLGLPHRRHVVCALRRNPGALLLRPDPLLFQQPARSQIAAGHHLRSTCSPSPPSPTWPTNWPAGCARPKSS